jgi:hypothetical protein
MQTPVQSRAVTRRGVACVQVRSLGAGIMPSPKTEDLQGPGGNSNPTHVACFSPQGDRHWCFCPGATPREGKYECCPNGCHLDNDNCCVCN